MAWRTPFAFSTTFLFSLLCAAPVLRAQGGTSVWDGVYTAAQAARGKAGYGKSCSSCHGDALDGSGGQSPALAGKDFMMNWTGMTLGDLFDRIQSTMPADNPGSLKPADAADILAYMLQVNMFPAGQTELASDTAALKKIKIEATKPAK
ncbi:MAG TPA: cytochrome c [Bryobacteraceae bacterium]|nr:cytochrome c [Bryobacteraceae bacterium]